MQFQGIGRPQQMGGSLPKGLQFKNLSIRAANPPFLACRGLVGSIPAASIKHIFLYAFLCVPWKINTIMLCLYIRLFRCTSVPSQGGVRSGISSRTGDSFHNLQGHIIPILYNAFKSVVRLFCFVGLISLHWRNKTAVQGKSQSHKVKTNKNRSRSSLYNML